MATLIVRNLDERIARRLREEARRHDKSVNGLVLQLISENVGSATARRRRRVYHDLDHLAGTWTRAQAAAIGRRIRGQRKIDPDLWR